MDARAPQATPGPLALASQEWRGELYARAGSPSTAAAPLPASRSHPRRSCVRCRRSTGKPPSPDRQSARVAGSREADGAPACAVQSLGSVPCRPEPFMAAAWRCQTSASRSSAPAPAMRSCELSSTSRVTMSHSARRLWSPGVLRHAPVDASRR